MMEETATRWSRAAAHTQADDDGVAPVCAGGALAYPASAEAIDASKLGTLAGSLLSALLGFAVLRFIAPAIADEEEAAEAWEIFGADQPGDGRQ